MVELDKSTLLVHLFAELMKNLLIRPVKEKDAKGAMKAFFEITKTSRWILTQPSEVPKKIGLEREFIRKYKKGKKSCFILAEIEGEIVGFMSADGGIRKQNAHTANLGIAIRKKWRGHGIGSEMMKYVIGWAKEAGLKKLRLSVMEPNKIAYRLYKKFGFRKEGLFRREVKIGRRFYNTIELARFL